MAWEEVVEQELNYYRPVRLTMVVKLPQEYTNVRTGETYISGSIMLTMADAQGTRMRVLPLASGVKIEAEMLERAQRLTEFLLQRGFKIAQQESNTTMLERPLTADDELTLLQRLLNAFGDMPIPTLQISSTMNHYYAYFGDQKVNLGRPRNRKELDEHAQLEDWLQAQGFKKVKSVVDDERYGEFSTYYERNI